MKVQASRFNFFIEDEGIKYLYNALTGNIIQILPEYEEIVKKLCTDRKNQIEPRNLSPDTQAMVGPLLERGFLVSEELNEIDLLKIRYRKSFAEKTFSLVIEPTLACNFKCVYCFEEEPLPHSMSNKEEEALIKFVERMFQQEIFHGLKVSWFGGEPLLSVPVIDRLSNAFKKIVEDFKIDSEISDGITYSAGLVTNGSLLTPEIFPKLLEWNIKNVQITIDGPPEIHNKNRPYKNGRGSFDTVFSNFLSFIKWKKENLHNIGITLRVNFYLEDRDKVATLLGDVPEMFRGDISVYFKHIFPKSSEWKANRRHSTCQSYDEISKSEVYLSKLALEMGYNVKRFSRFGVGYYCPSSTLYHFEIDPHLNVYKCNVAIGNRAPAGKINLDGSLSTDIIELSKWLSIDPFEDEVCRNCKFLPLCMGGCPHSRIIGGRGCLSDTRAFNEAIKLVIKSEKIKQGGQND